MQQDTVCDEFKLDIQGTPTGGMSHGVGIDIRWQEGPLGEAAGGDPNGARVEGVLAAALARLRFYQATAFACRENDQAIVKIEEALHWLYHRAVERERRGVRGTHLP